MSKKRHKTTNIARKMSKMSKNSQNAECGQKSRKTKIIPTKKRKAVKY